MRTIHQVVLHTPAGQKLTMSVERAKPGEYKVVGCEDLESLEGQNLAFDVDTFPGDAVNKDYSSDSFSCFGRSEAFSTKDFSFNRDTFFAESLPLLRKGLERVKGSFIDCAEY